MIIFYTAMILILYSLNDLDMIWDTTIIRIGYNLLGVLIGVFIVVYPFPHIYPKVHKWVKEQVAAAKKEQ